MKLSIIVPVYNVEKYIVKCISSLLNQNSNDYEVIIINDGTKDRSIELIKENFNDARIRIINQKNKGLSGARNTGLRKVKGEYIWFFDSDDWLEYNTLQHLFPLLNNTDIIYCSSYYQDTSSKTSIKQTTSGCKSGRELSLKNYFHPVQFYIYKRDFLINNHFLFEEGILHEDTLFTPQILYSSTNNIKELKQPIYHLLRREDSISQSFNPKRCYDLAKVISKLMSFAENKVEKGDRYKWGNCIAEATNELLYLSKSGNSQLRCDINVFLNNNKSVVRYLSKANKIPTRILGCICLYLGTNLMKTYNFLYNIRYWKL